MIRVVVDISRHGEVRWRDFGRDDGEPIGDGSFVLETSYKWAGRLATDEACVGADSAYLGDREYLYGRVATRAMGRTGPWKGLP